jgi:hypothetical protein
MSQKPVFSEGPKIEFIATIYSRKTLFLLGTKEPSQKKRLLAYEHLNITDRLLVGRAAAGAPPEV